MIEEARRSSARPATSPAASCCRPWPRCAPRAGFPRLSTSSAPPARTGTTRRFGATRPSASTSMPPTCRPQPGRRWCARCATGRSTSTTRRASRLGRSAPAGATPVAAYLALPPGVFADGGDARSARSGLPAGSRIVLEKPFGEDLTARWRSTRCWPGWSAQRASRRCSASTTSSGMATVQNLLGAAAGQPVLEPCGTATHIEQVDILWDETLALEGRAGYYDRRRRAQGRDAEPPAADPVPGRDGAPGEPRRARPARPQGRRRCARCARRARATMASRTRRARYTAGRLAATAARPRVRRRGRRRPGARAPRPSPRSCSSSTAGAGPAPASCCAPARRWAPPQGGRRAVPAACPHRRSATTASARVNELRIGLDGPEDLTLRLTGSAGGRPPRLAPLDLSAEPPAAELPAYSRVLLDVLEGATPCRSAATKPRRPGAS